MQNVHTLTHNRTRTLFIAVVYLAGKAHGKSCHNADIMAIRRLLFEEVGN